MTEEPKKLLCPKAGTATSSPAIRTSSPSNLNIVNVMLWMKRNAYEETTIKATSHRRSNKVCRSGFPIRSNNTRRYNAIQKTQMTILLFSLQHARKMWQ